MKDLIRDVPDFPIPGIIFRDIFPLLEANFSEVIDELAKRIDNAKEIDHVVGIESRGFIFAAALAYKLNKGFIPIRKKGKLPPSPLLRAIKVSMEYGEVELEMFATSGSQRLKVVIVDDVMATGETLRASWDLCIASGYLPQQALVLVNIQSAAKKPNYLAVKSLLDYK